MQRSRTSELRHAIRGAMNAIKLCVSALDMPMEPHEKVEFLSDVANSAGKISTLLDEMDALPPDPPEPGSAEPR